MAKIDKTVIHETCYIAIWVAIFSLAMQAVYITIGAWDYTVILGNLLSGGISILNFFLIGITVQKAVVKDEKGARDTIKFSQSMRMLMLFVVVGAGVWMPWCDNWAVLIPLLFPRVAIFLSSVLRKKNKDEEADA